jgi:glutathione S-transferase
LKLFTTTASPWVRKCVVSIIELGIRDRVEFIPTRWPHSWATKTVDYVPDFIAATPVARIPALVTDDGLRLTDSGAICDYLNAEFGNYRLMPREGELRWRMLSVISIANGLIEAQIYRRAELLRQESERSVDFIEKMKQREHRCYRALDPLIGQFKSDFDLAQLSVAVGCSYADFRFTEDDWRQESPNLARWFEEFIKRPSMQSTMPAETPQ